MHLFDLYRFLLMIVCTVYAAVRMAQALQDWLARLGGADRQTRLARRYVEVMLASVRIRRFWPEISQIAALAAALVALIIAHRYVME